MWLRAAEALTAEPSPCYLQGIVTTTRASWAKGVRVGCALGLLLAGCRGLRPSSVPLGGTHEEDAPVAKAARPIDSSAVAAAPASTSTTAQELAELASAEVSTITPTDAAPSAKAPAAAGPFQVKPYAAHQVWTRLFDLEFALKVGPGGSIEMKMVSHQEARFEVLAVNSGSIEKLSIEYPVYTTKTTIMGAAQDSPEELAGKRFVVSFARGKPEVRDASGNTPPKKQLDSVKDDAREPLEIEKALQELTLLTAKGRGDFTTAGAVALAGGEDEDTKVTSARASLLKLTTTSHAEKLALLELGYTLTNALDDTSTIEVQVAGTLNVLDAPSRYQTSTLQGPMEIRSSEPGGMQGRGTIKVTTSYKY